MLAAKIVDAIRSVIGDASPEKPIALHEPLMGKNESLYVQNCITKNQVTQGEYIERFEQMLCDFTGFKYAVATSSGTTALHTAYLAHGITAGCQAYIPTLTFIATANAMLQTGARVDLYDGFLMCVKGTAIINTNLLGRVTESMDRPEVVHDSAQALGSKLQEKGTHVLSFNGNKIITCGQGGAIVTNFKDVADKARRLINQSRIPHAWEIKHDAAGFNYRMANINAAIGCGQLEQLPHILKAKRALAKRYAEAFEGVKMWEEPNEESNHWLNAVVIEEEQEATLIALHSAGYLARKLPIPLHLLPMYNKVKPHHDFSWAEKQWKETICLPSSPILGMKYA